MAEQPRHPSGNGQFVKPGGRVQQGGSKKVKK